MRFLVIKKRKKKEPVVSNKCLAFLTTLSPLSLECMAAVLAVGRSVLVEEAAFGRHGRGGGQVQATVAVVAAAVLLLHVCARYLLPQLLQLSWNHACHKNKLDN